MTKLKNKAQVKIGMPNAKYHAEREYFNSSRIKLAKKSLAHLKTDDDAYNPNDAEEYKLHFEIGKAFEWKLQDPKHADENIIVMPEQEWIEEALLDNPKLQEPTRSKVYRESKEQFITENEHKCILTAESFNTVNTMVRSCMKNELIKNLISVPDEDGQLSIFWADPKTGLKLKTRPDIVNKQAETIIEIKTIEDGSPESFSKQAANLDYYSQAALQIKGCLESGLIKNVKHFFWLVVEKKAPFNAQLYRFQADDIQFCTDSLEFTIEQIAAAVETGKWKGYEARADNDLGIIDLEIPLYYRR